eukprot:scaffold1.g5283.t1
MAPIGQLAGKVALVTGSSTGIGMGILRSLAAAGATTVMHGLVPEAELRDKAGAVASEFGSRVTYSSANLLKPQEIRDMVRAAQDEHGRLDILVNNAGVQYVAPVHEFPEASERCRVEAVRCVEDAAAAAGAEKWDDIIGVILSSTFHATKAALPGMLDAGWGRIVNTGSMHALVASPFKSAYNAGASPAPAAGAAPRAGASKHGVAGLTKTAALEVATRGVTVNCVCPGYVMTELIERQLENQARTRGISKERVITEVLLADQPIKRFVKPREVGELVRHLCSDDAAAITGACLSIDGGWVAQ